MIAAAATPPVVAPATLAAAVLALASHPALSIVAGGTDVMVAVNDGRAVPEGWLSLHRIDELGGIEVHDDGSTTIGATVTMARLLAEVADRHPSLCRAARTVGSPQIRSAATLGGNVMTASPAGDTLPVLVAAGASVELVSSRGSRRLPIDRFLMGPKRTAAAPDELLRSIHVPARRERELFLKVGPRNAMVIAVCSLAVAFDPDGPSAAAVGSVAPTVRAVPGASELLADPAAAEAFAAAVGAVAEPIDDLRATAAYRRHALTTLARRAHRRLHDADPVLPWS
jgi:CO/xanthine dehydrogenase FAD-binding subunit